jgi:hypothetical protein
MLMRNVSHEISLGAINIAVYLGDALAQFDLLNKSLKE